MDAQQLREDVRAGRVDAERLVDLMVMLQGPLQNTPRELRAAQQQIAELQRQLGASPTPRLDQPYSLRGEEQRQQERGGSFKTFVAGFARIQPCRFPRNS